MKINSLKDNAFVMAAIECAFFVSTENDEPFSHFGFSFEQISEGSLFKISLDCHRFSLACGNFWREHGWTDEQAGHDFWLSRNGHGTGFFDRSEICGDDRVRNALQMAAESVGECNLYVGDDNMIYCE
jgi:hypothetical protein